MHCSFLTQVVPCCLRGWHQCFLLYVSSCSLGEVAFNNRTHCILRMFPDSVSICPFVAPVESFKSFASCLAFFVCSSGCAQVFFAYPGIVFCFSYVAVQQQDLSFACTIPCQLAFELHLWLGCGVRCSLLCLCHSCSY